MSRWPRALAVAALVLAIGSYSAAQSSSCQAPVLRSVPPGANIFSDKQEMQLAAIFHSKIEQDFKIIDDETLTGELQRIGDRLVVSMPKSDIKFRYDIVDLPEANALSEPGGNIFLSRKLIAFVRSEDELAGVMAHEMGHIVTHQGAIELSRLMKNVLGITKLTDADDVEERFNDLLDSSEKKSSAFRARDREEEGQLGADQVAVYALGAAGYDVKSLAVFWDRFTQNKGKKGSLLGDLFGSTSEESRRFRDMLKNSQAVAANCVGKHPEGSAADFKKWQASVVAYDGIGHREKLPGLIAQKTLTPPLRSDIVKLRVSPDGKYLLAQDQASIQVLNRENLKPIFHIDAEDARSVQFTEDSKGINFYTINLFSSPRIESWDIEEKALREVNELRVQRGCNQAALSPNGKYFACISPEESDVFGGILMNLRLLNAETSEVVFEKKNLFRADGMFFVFNILAMMKERGSISEFIVGALHFTPDSKYLLFGRPDVVCAVETASGMKLNVPGSIKEIMQGDFSFLDGNRIIGVAGSKGDKGAVLKFPSGDVVYSNLKMGWAHIDGASGGDYALLHPLKDYSIGVFDVKNNRYSLGSKKGTADVYNGVYVREQLSGEVATYDLVNQKELNKVELHQSPLGRITAAAASDDLNYVAISGTLNGAIWNLTQGTRVSQLRSFEAVAVDDAGFAVADFRAAEKDGKRQFAQIDTLKNHAESFTADEDVASRQAGPYLILRVPEKKNEWDKNVSLQVKLIKTNSLIWQRKFANGVPAYHLAPEIDSLVFLYDVGDKDAKALMQANEELRAKVAALKTRQRAYVIEAVDIKTGKTLSEIAIDTGKGSFHLRDAFIAGKSLVVADDQDRVQAFRFDGVRKGRFQSHFATASRDGRVLAADIGRGKLAIYDLENFKKTDELDFISRIAMARFSSSGDRLLVVTRDQKAYYFDTKQLLAGTQVAAK